MEVMNSFPCLFPMQLPAIAQNKPPAIAQNKPPAIAQNEPHVSRRSVTTEDFGSPIDSNRRQSFPTLKGILCFDEPKNEKNKMRRNVIANPIRLESFLPRTKTYR